MDDATIQHIQPYQYVKLHGNRVMIYNPQGARIILFRSQIVNALNRGGHWLREISAHERVMYETALKVLDGVQ